jgi:DNA-directed RNA polymerase subunit RPC12/RpoP
MIIDLKPNQYSVTAVTELQGDTSLIPVTLKCVRCGQPITGPVHWVRTWKESERIFTPQPACLNCEPVETDTSWAKTKIICIECGRIIYLNTNVLGTRRYCSIKCFNKSRSRRQLLKRRSDRTGLTCLQCGEKFNATRDDQRYCSVACKQKAYRIRLTKLLIR